MLNGRFLRPKAVNSMQNRKFQLQNVANSMQHGRFQLPNAAKNMQNERFQLQNAANSMQHGREVACITSSVKVVFALLSGHNTKSDLLG